MTRSGRFEGVRRTAVDLDDASLVTCVPGEAGSVAVISPTVADLDLGWWLSQHRPLLDRELKRSGAVVLAGFAGLADEAEVQASLERAGRPTVRYLERSTPRRQLAGNVYTSTEYPADQEIALHCELTAAQRIPRYVWFVCIEEPGSGGQTPVADTRRVLANLPADLVDEFRRKGWRLIRNYGTGFGPGWQEAMQTDSREDVETYCRANDIEFTWLDGDRLRTEQVRSAVDTHPDTGEEVWFNHVAFWHESTLDDTVHAEMVAVLGRDGLPYQVTYGDGNPIAAEAITEIKRAYALALRERPWRRGDVMVVDNLLSAHGRRPFTGRRKIVVAMTDPIERRPHQPTGRVAA